MSAREFSVAMTEALHLELTDHLVRDDGQEDLCLALYAPSRGLSRDSALLREVRLPNPGEHQVHGNVTFFGHYVLRVAREAKILGLGVAILHSHPEATGWQLLGKLDREAELSYSLLVEQITELPLVGMTLAAGDGTWAARSWPNSKTLHATNVRVIGSSLRISWNHQISPPPATTPSQVRTVAAWGADLQADFARVRVLVVGLGSVGMDVAVRLAATGLQRVGGMDFDFVKEHNRDRLVFATAADVAQATKKVVVAQRATETAATAADFRFEAHDETVTTDNGIRIALDYDLIISCVDRPWPRGVLNQLGYSDLIPVIDGGIAIDPLPGGGMRNATIRTHVLRPGRPCMQCNRQLDPADVAKDRLGLFDDLHYISQTGGQEPPRENVAILSISVVASLLAQLVSFVASPAGIGEPGPLRFWLSSHRLEHVECIPNPTCLCASKVAAGEARINYVSTTQAR